ncbi:PAS domain S-box-containing protein [Micromonospora pattaloongensis]|uniref:histidine kinase n=1 Tax=Micromonospora pattaloongensis TaxID=405436 RepID=A0A1H3NN54_9ACTN|nr:PAS domain S-box protein [Micromonospora pattaloongensis]SDY90110.1 PAS domain S-box-containing protein [Micromonospora pattaloongensis]
MSGGTEQRRRWPLRTYVVALVVLFIVASAISSAYQRAQAEQYARRAAVEDATFAARLAARDIGDALAALQKALDETVANPAIAQAFAPDLDPGACSLSFSGVGAFKSGHLDVIRADGTVACSSLKDRRVPGYRGAPWLAEARSTRGVLGPVTDDRTGRYVMIGSAPVGRLGMVAGFLDLESLGPALATMYGGPRQLSMLVTSADGATAVTRSIDSRRWTGASLRDTPFAADAGLVERRDPDGVRRLYGAATVPEIDWQVHAGADQNRALAAARELSTRQSTITLAGLLVVLVAAAVFHRRILRPVRRLSIAVRTAGATGNTPVPVTGPAELADLAEDFNRMTAAAERHLAEVSRLAAIVHSSVDAIIGKTLDGIITNWNDGAMAVYGYRAEEICGRHISVIVPPHLHPELEELLRRIRRGERVERLETQRVRKDGTVIEVSVTISPIHDGAGRVVGAAAVGRDITEEKRAAAERACLQQRLHQSQRLESLGQLAGGVAHDFNNLLAVILSCTELLADELDAASAAGRDVQAIQRAAERGARLTRQLLIFGRKDTTRPELLDLNAVVADLQELLARSIGQHVELVVRGASELPAVRADRGQLEQVLVNLAVNARDAMPDGGRLTIETASVDVDEVYAQLHPQLTPGRYVQLLVSDTGTGMAPEVVARAFEPFFTTKPKGTGTGLGLATVYGIVAEAGGTVTIYSEPGLGTTFRVYLPEVVGARPAPTTHAPAPVARGRGETILVVEDEAALREATTRLLRRNGYEVVEAGNGIEALEAAANTRWDLLLTDVVMPHMSGRELAERLRLHRPDLRVLFMSGYSQEVLGPGKALDEGVTLLAKPFTEAALLAKVHAALAGGVAGSPSLHPGG